MSRHNVLGLNQEKLEDSILSVNSSLPSAACIVRDDAKFTVDCLLLDPESLEPHADTSFTSQMHSLIEKYGEVDAEIDRPPEIFLFTANSAIQYADLVRGYFGLSVDNQIPRIGFIKASREKWRTQYDFDKESERLHDVTNGYTHVCVVEEFVSSGRTLIYASKLLHHAGVQTITAIRGTWDGYGVRKNEVDFEAVASTDTNVRKRLTDLGKAARFLAEGISTPAHT